MPGHIVLVHELEGMVKFEGLKTKLKCEFDSR